MFKPSIKLTSSTPVKQQIALAYMIEFNRLNYQLVGMQERVERDRVYSRKHPEMWCFNSKKYRRIRKAHAIARNRLIELKSEMDHIQITLEHLS